MKKFLKRLNRKQTGFTLIELLVVIAIIGILAAIIVPNVSKYIGGGQTAANESELKLVQNAVAAAMADARASVWEDNTTLKISVSDIVISKTVNPSITGPTLRTAAVGDYFSNSNLSSLTQTYGISRTGNVTVTP